MQLSGPELPPGALIPNVATLLEMNAHLFGDRQVYCEKRDGVYEGITWKALCADVRSIAHNLRTRYGFKPGEKLVIFSPNLSLIHI